MGLGHGFTFWWLVDFPAAAAIVACCALLVRRGKPRSRLEELERWNDAHFEASMAHPDDRALAVRLADQAVCPHKKRHVEYPSDVLPDPEELTGQYDGWYQCDRCHKVLGKWVDPGDGYYDY